MVSVDVPVHDEEGVMETVIAAEGLVVIVQEGVDVTVPVLVLDGVWVREGVGNGVWVGDVPLLGVRDPVCVPLRVDVLVKVLVGVPDIVFEGVRVYVGV
jgi:hypothetical protein